jgi:hypothetical protein
MSRTISARIVPGIGAGKVFAIGFNKTATTSLHDIFVQLGYASYHGTAWRDTSQSLFYYKYDCFSDGPPTDFRQLDRMFARSRFILQVRNLDEWIDSRLEHIKRPGGNEKTRVGRWAPVDDSVCAWVQRRNNYHADVLQYFDERPDDFLLVNYIRNPGGADRIREFLGGRRLGEKPHSNRNPNSDITLRNAEQIARCLTGMGIPESEWKNDLICPSLPPETTGHDLPGDTGELTGGVSTATQK